MESPSKSGRTSHRAYCCYQEHDSYAETFRYAGNEARFTGITRTFKPALFFLFSFAFLPGVVLSGTSKINLQYLSFRSKGRKKPMYHTHLILTQEGRCPWQ